MKKQPAAKFSLLFYPSPLLLALSIVSFSLLTQFQVFSQQKIPAHSQTEKKSEGLPFDNGNFADEEEHW